MAADSAVSHATIAAVELFAGLSPQAIAEIAAAARLRRLPKDARVFDQGQTATHAHALLEGSVGIMQSGSDGAQVIVRLIAPGQTFGTIGLFTDRRYPAEARTLTEVLEASWSETQLLQLMQRHPRIALNVIRIIGTRLQEVQERLRELSTQRVEQRIAHALLRLSRQAGSSTAEGTAIEFPLRRKDLAEMSGATLHTVSRILTAWEKAGVLTSSRQRLTVRRLADLQRIAQHSAD